MHLTSVTLHPDTYPVQDRYPFNLPIFHPPQSIAFTTPVTLFVGENGTGKSTLLEALAHRCGIHIWKDASRSRFEINPYEDQLYRFLSVIWTCGPVPGSFFGSDIFHDFAQILDGWAAADPGQLEHFGGKSLLTQSHGQSLMTFFRNRYRIKGLYLLDEPETGLSPRSQIELLEILANVDDGEKAQFIISTHSPLLLACPNAVIYNFNAAPLRTISYEETEHHRIYKSFMEDRSSYLAP